MNIPMAVQGCKVCNGTGLVPIREPGGVYVTQAPCSCVEYLQIRSLPVIMPERPTHQNIAYCQNQRITHLIRTYEPLVVVLVLLILVPR